MELPERLKLFMDHKGINSNALEREIDAGTGTIAKTITQGKSLSVETLKKIIGKYPELNLDWLILGQGEMLGKSRLQEKHDKSELGQLSTVMEHAAPYQVQRQSQGISQAQTQGMGTHSDVHIVVETSDGDPLVTLVSERAAAGWARGFADQTFYEDLPRFSIPRYLLRPGAEYFVVETIGNSMSPAIKDRDLLLIRRIVNRYELRNGMVGVVLTLDGLQVKRIEVLPVLQIRLHSDNPRYQPQTLNIGDCIALFHVERRLTSELDNPLDSFYSYFDTFQQRLTRLENDSQNQPFQQ